MDVYAAEKPLDNGTSPAIVMMLGSYSLGIAQKFFFTFSALFYHSKGLLQATLALFSHYFSSYFSWSEGLAVLGFGVVQMSPTLGSRELCRVFGLRVKGMLFHTVVRWKEEIPEIRVERGGGVLA